MLTFIAIARMTLLSLALSHIRHATLWGVGGWGGVGWDVKVQCNCKNDLLSLALPHIRHATLVARSLALPHIRHATLLARSLALPHLRHATLLSLSLALPFNICNIYVTLCVPSS